ncbi:S1 family peptidase [Pinirhizobacter soli]|uniref:S1 family peptidase n=1 Tax=Pinirhizobacter soli TaxID=2786953 RepID=UPI002029BA78|nr:trypsin-like peptidase domain-containing protein [Pinirhizobacter soli]
MSLNGYVRHLASAAFLSFMAPAMAVTLDASQLPKVQAATFEVVVPKAENPKITYDRPLPLDALPFQVRNDKYNSIGTAFAIGQNRYVTASHVAQLGIGGLYGKPLLRDAQGKVYAIDKVLQYSLGEDFMVFSLVDGPQVAPLKADRGSHLNEAVYAVGNALGTGVVVRDGLYTSNTPEEQDGRWRWIRFSAAASPGNSGGPLLDKDGDVIGVVLRKSPNENLNFALPIDRVLDASTRVSESNERSTLRPEFIYATQTGTLHMRFNLPMAFDDFAASWQKQDDAFADQQWQALMALEDAKIFPKGDGSHAVLSASAPINAFPEGLNRDVNGTWERSMPQHHRTNTVSNGYMEAGVVGGSLLFHFRKPDGMSLASLVADPKAMMDEMLKGAQLTRDVGQEKVRITSLGPPAVDTVFVDRWQRRWQRREFDLPFVDVGLLMYTLPVPDGFIGIMRYTPAQQLHAARTQVESAANFVSASYIGSLDDWQQFMKLTAWLPEPVAASKVDIEYGKHFAFASSAFSLAFDTDVLRIEPTGNFALPFTFIDRGDGVKLDIAGISVRQDVNKTADVRINRHPKPFPYAPERSLGAWNQVLKREHPQDGIPFKKDDTTWAGVVAGTPAAEPKALYTLFYGDDGSPPDATMKDKLDKLVKGTTINEH